MITAIIDYQFMQNALISALLASIVCGIIGTIIVEKKIVMLSGGIAHASFGGIGLGYMLGFEPIIGGMIFAIASSIGIVKIKHKTNTSPDVLIGILWSLGMALGILFISLTPGYPPNMTTYLFGDILTVSSTDIVIISILTIIIIMSILCFFNYIKAYLFDERYMKTFGLNVMFIEYFLFILIGLSIIILIKVVGIILVITLLTVPASIVKMFSNNFNRNILISMIVGAIICLCGLTMSYYLNIPSGATIIVFGSVLYLIMSLVKSINDN
jgi:zinc transport system permease protein